MKPINITLNALFFSLIILFIWAFSFDGFNKKIAHADNYRYPASPIKLGDVSSRIDRSNDVVISTKFRIPKKNLAIEKSIPYYENLFQTSDVNYGIRLEITFGAEGALGWGIAIGDQTGNFKGFDLGPPPLTDIWHELIVTLNKDSIEGVLDGHVVLSSKVELPQYLANELIVGRGFTDERVFSGEINTFEIQNVSELTGLMAKYHMNVILALMIMLFWIAFTPPKSKKKRGISITFADYDSLKFISFFLMYIAFFIYFKSSYLSLKNSGPLHDVIQIIFIIWISTFLLNYITNTKFRTLYLLLVITLNFVFFTLLIAGSIFLDKTQTTVSGAYTGELGALYQTNLQEALEFFWVYFDIKEMLAIFSIACLTTVAFVFTMKSNSLISKSKSSSIIALAVLIAVYFTHPYVESVVSSIFKGYDSYTENVNEFKSLVSQRSSSGNVNAKVATVGNTYIVIIGESSSRDHYSSYGYFRETTPYLDKQLSGSNWIFFKRAYSSFVHTTPSLLHALTEANQYNAKDYQKATSLIEIFNAAGFDTYWIDEQGRAAGDNPINVIASSAKKFKIVPPNNGELIRQFDNVLSNIDTHKNNLIVLHLMGSHFDYKMRLPKNYKYQFNDTVEELGDYANDEKFVSDVLDPYDTTIRYTDSVLSDLQESAKKHSIKPDLFIYFSDHGEDVYGKKFHNAAQFTYPMARVPFILNYSERWATGNPEKINILKKRVDNVFTLDLMYETLLGLADIQGYEYDKGFDFGSTAYRINLDNAITMKTGKELNERLYAKTPMFKIADDPKIIAEENIKYLNKYYPYKVLSVNNDIKSKVFETHAIGFVGMEFNVTIPQNTLGHYPEVILSTSLNQFMSWKQTESPKKLWLDVKMPATASLEESISLFNNLDTNFNIKGRSIIESQSNSLKFFSQEGWFTSFYILFKKDYPLSRDWHNCDGASMYTEKCADEVVNAIKEVNPKSISFYAHNYGFIKKFIEPKISSSIVYNTFGLPQEINIYNKNFPSLVKENPLFKDPKINSILLESSQTFGLTMN